MDSLLINKIFENIKKNDIFPGCIVASVSKERPNYYYHWTRDAALVMRSIIKYFKLTKDLKCFKQIIDYINVESRFQKLSTLSGLGEPKYNVDLTSFNDTWGRPQNDGPALRGLIMLELYRLLEDYPFLLEQVSKIILNDLNYVLQNINQPSFDLWEEVYGYHLYTRGVQYKFLKEVLVSDIFPDLQKNIIMGKNTLKELISHHQITMTSFDTNGKSCREYDTSLLLLVNHIDYDRDVVDILDPIFIDYIKRMINYYQREYSINQRSDIIWLGRYLNDRYYEGNPWIICTTALYQLVLKYKELKNEELVIDFIPFKKYIESRKQLNLDEQLDRFSGRGVSAKNLTWNYSEIYIFYRMLDTYLNSF